MTADNLKKSDGLGPYPPDVDPKTGETSGETLGVAFGALAGGAAAGSAGLAMGGPAGMVVGAIAGGLAGAYTARSVEGDLGRAFDASFWQDHYPASSYYDERTSFDRYEPAYRLGWESYDPANPNDGWESQELRLKEQWESNRDVDKRLAWSRAREAAHEAWLRAATLFPRHSDIDRTGLS